MSAEDYIVHIIDRDRQRLGQADEFYGLDLVLRFNGVHSWAITFGAGTKEAALMAAGGGIEVERRGASLLDGPARVFERSWSGEKDTLALAGHSQMVKLKRRRVQPVPSGPPYTAASHDVRTGPAETVITGYVDDHAGPNAKPGRAVPGLSVAVNPAPLGTAVTGRARFTPLLDLIQAKALEGGGLGFKIEEMVFSVFEPQDVSAEVVFSREIGNLAEFTYRVEAPEGNYLYAGGSGEAEARLFEEKGDSASITRWGRIEHFLDHRNVGSASELLEIIDAKLLELGERTALTIAPIDTETIQFGRDYDLGDRVSVVVDGVEIVDVVREVAISLSKEKGESVRPVIGTAGATKADGLVELFDQQRRLIERIDYIERSF